MKTDAYRLARHFAPFRKFFPFWKTRVHLDTAKICPHNLFVQEKLDEFYRDWLEGEVNFDFETFGMLDGIRKMCAELVGANADEIGFCPNTSLGLNICTSGLEWKPGDEVLLSELEFPADVYLLRPLTEKGVVVRYLKAEKGYVAPEELAVNLTPHSKLFITSFVQFFNGYKQDLAALAEVCHKNGTLLVVDGIQGVGNQQLDVHTSGVDFLAAGAQKWLLSSHGTGFFYCSRELQKKIKPAYFGWMGVDWKVDWTDLWKKDLQPFDSARRFEIGSHPHGPVRHFYWSLTLIKKAGLAKIEKYTRALLDLLVEYLSDSPYHLRSSREPPHRSSILSFSHPNGAELVKYLKSRKIIASYREGGVRVSPNFYNSPQEMERLIDELKRFGKRKISRK